MGASFPDTEKPTVRLRDVISLAVTGLFQHRLRTTLTTLGVLCGSFVLVVSLAIGQGVQETILREAAKYGDLRTVEVHGAARRGPGGESVEVKGVMSNERRERKERNDERDKRPVAAHKASFNGETPGKRPAPNARTLRLVN